MRCTEARQRWIGIQFILVTFCVRGHAAPQVGAVGIAPASEIERHDGSGTTLNKHLNEPLANEAASPGDHASRGYATC